MKLHKLFLDANVFVAATKSPQGGSRFILNLAEKGKVRVSTVRHALREAERNIEDKFGKEYLQEYYQLLFTTDLFLQPLGKIEGHMVLELEQIITKKDIPIILGAFYSGCDFLITLDRKDLLDNDKLGKFPFKIITPGDFIQYFL